MSQANIPPARGAALYEVTCLRAGANARTATELDFLNVRVQAPNALTARLIVRNECADCANAFEAKLVGADVKQYVAIIGGHRIETSAAVVEHYRRAFRQLPWTSPR